MTAQNGNFKTACLFGLVPAPESGRATHWNLLELKQLLARQKQ